MTLDYDSILEYIDAFPEYDDPMIFGMNSYTEKLMLSQRADQLIQSINVMEPRKSTNMHGYVEKTCHFCHVQINLSRNFSTVVLQKMTTISF